MSSAILEGGRFADVQEPRFQAAYGLFRPAKGVDLLMVRKSVFRLRNVQIWTVPSCKAVDLLKFRNGFFRQRDIRYGQGHPAYGSYADAQESRIQPATRSDMGSAVL